MLFIYIYICIYRVCISLSRSTVSTREPNKKPAVYSSPYDSGQEVFATIHHLVVGKRFYPLHTVSYILIAFMSLVHTYTYIPLLLSHLVHTYIHSIAFTVISTHIHVHIFHCFYVISTHTHVL